MNNNPSVAKRWIIIMLLLEDGVMEKCVTVSLRMTSKIMKPFYAMKEGRFVTVHTKTEYSRNNLKEQMHLKKNAECYVLVDTDGRKGR